VEARLYPQLVCLLCLAFFLTGCGGDSRTAWQWYGPPTDAALVREAAPRFVDRAGGSGLVAPIGVRSFGDDHLIIDLLIIRPANATYYGADKADRTSRLLYFYFNAPAALSARGDACFTLTAAGRPVKQLPHDDHSPPSGADRLRHQLTDAPRYAEQEIRSSTGERYIAAGLPLFIRTATPIAAGEEVRLRLRHKPGSQTLSNIEYRGTARPVTTETGAEPPRAPAAHSGPELE
jgi:hypothetical protein